MLNTAQSSPEFDSQCTRCRRIQAHLRDVRRQHPDYHAAPVPPFGAARPSLLIVGLAPGMHGANATGRPFTGDHAGIILYKMLYEFGFSNQPVSTDGNDGLVLKHCRITNAVKCLPPQNKPEGAEIRNCNSYLRAELAQLRQRLVILALGRIAHEAVLRALDLKPRQFSFSHNALHRLDNQRWLLDSYHCSRYNTQTGRLTEAMFRQVFTNAAQTLHG